MTIPDHLTINEPAGTADCAACGTGVTVPPTFGGIGRGDFLGTFVVQHAVHTERRSGALVPAGLTTAGNPTPAARAALGLQDPP